MSGDRVQVSELAKKLGMRPTSSGRSMSELGRGISAHTGGMPAVVPIMAAWQRRRIDEQIREAMHRAAPIMREMSMQMQTIARQVSLTRTQFRRLFWTLERVQAEERARALAMQAWARRRGRRKGRA